MDKRLFVVTAEAVVLANSESDAVSVYRRCGSLDYSTLYCVEITDERMLDDSWRQALPFCDDVDNPDEKTCEEIWAQAGSIVRLEDGRPRLFDIESEER